MNAAKRYVIEMLRARDFTQIFMIDAIKGREYSYDMFFEKCLKIADMFSDISNDRQIVAVMENSFELVLLYFAMIFTDKHITVIDPQKGKEEITKIITEIESPYVISHDSKGFLDILDSENELHIEDIKEKTIQGIAERDFDSLFLVTFTSGTSGNTKGVKHSLSNLLMTAIALHDKVDISPDSRLLHLMPMTYMAGILNSLFYPFIVGASVVITERFSIMSARKFWKTVQTYEVNLFWLSPSMLMMIDQLDRGNIGEEYCKTHKLTFLIGTAPLTNEMRRKFNDRYHVCVYASYGLSETLFISVENEATLSRSGINCVGELLEGVECMIADSGELYLDVPWMYLGYTNENTDEYFDGRFYKSGDLVKIENDCLYITGRNKDLIIKGGMNISPALIENIVNRDHRIQESVVIGVHDRCGEEKVCCAYTRRVEDTDMAVFESELKKTVLEELGKNYSIDYLWEMKEIPRNINGKVDKNELRRQWEANNNG